MRTITILFALWALFYGNKTANVCSKQRCDYLKVLLPFFIILHHHAQRTDWPWLLDDDFCALGSPIVMMFFFISGYGLEYKRSVKGLPLREFPSRLKKLFAPTLFPIIMYVSGLLIIGHIEKLWSTLSISWYPLPFSWFVIVLAILYVGFYVCASIAKGGKTFLAYLFVYSVATVVALKLLNAPEYMITSDLAVFIGAWYKQSEDWLLTLLEAQWIRISVVIFSIVFVLAYLNLSGDMPKLLNLSRYVWLVLMFAMFAYVSIFKSRVIDFFTKISYDVYLCQGIAIGIVPYKEMNFYSSFIAIVLLTICIATFSHKVNEKVLTQL